MEPSEAIKTAHHAVMEAALPPEFQEAAFSEVLRHLLRQSGHPSNEGSGQLMPAMPIAEPLGLSRLAARVGVSPSALADIFAIDGDSVTLHVASSRIAQAKSRATREIALLVTAARQGSGVDEGWTVVEQVREALQHYKRYDTNNFSAYLRGVADAFNFRGKGTSTEIRLTQPGWEMAVTLITTLAQETV